jgi:hypothetical protein
MPLKELVDKLSDIEFARTFAKHRERILSDPIAFFIKGTGYLDFLPSAAQSVALKLAFGQTLDDTVKYLVPQERMTADGTFCLMDSEMTEFELYNYMTDINYDKTKNPVLNYLDFIVGRRGGKTTLAAALSCFCSIKEDWSKYLEKTPVATILILSPTKELSQEILEIVRNMYQNSPVLNRLIDTKKRNTQSTFNIKVPFIEIVDGKEQVHFSRVQIKVGAASKKTTRGIAACAVICDEISFWGTDEKFAETDVDILRAVKPAQAQFKDKFLLIKLSSPGIKQGVLYDEYQKRFELPESYAVFKAPSWVWNPSKFTEGFLRTELDLDPTGFASEYRGDFVDSLSDFISPESLDATILKGKTFLTPEAKGEDAVYTAAIDAAFKGDRFAFTVMGQHGARIKQYVMNTWQGTRKDPVKSREVAQYISTVCKEFGISRVHADQYAFQPLKEIFEQYGVNLIETPFTNTFKKQIYYNLKQMIHNLKIDLLDNHINISEIKQLKVEQTSTGLVRIGHPPGGHDDCADVTAISTYILAMNMNKGGVLDVAEIAGDFGMDYNPDANTISQAPSAEMLGAMYGYEIFNNSAMYVRDPKDGQMKRYDEMEEADEDKSGEVGGDFVFA